MFIQYDKAIRFFFFSDGITLKERNRLKVYLKTLFKKEGKTIDFINYIFCSDQYLQKINKNYLQHNFYTDILTFDLSDNGNSVKAEIYISIDRVRENASKLGVSIKSELHRVIFHGALHLCGYGDKRNEEQRKMRQMEDFYLFKYFN